MKSKKINKQSFQQPYSNPPKKNALVSLSSKETYTVSDISMVVDPPVININHSLPSSNTNTSNSRILQVFSPIYSSLFFQSSITLQLVGDNMFVAQQYAESNMPVPQGQGIDNSTKSSLNSSVISYNDNQRADLNLQNSFFA